MKDTIFAWRRGAPRQMQPCEKMDAIGVRCSRGCHWDMQTARIYPWPRIFLVTPNQGHLDDFCQRVAYMLSLSLSDLFTTCDKWPFQDFSRCLKDLMGLIWWIMVVGLQIPTYIAAGSGFLRSKAVWSRPLPASMVAQELVPLEKGAGKLVVGTL